MIQKLLMLSTSCKKHTEDDDFFLSKNILLLTMATQQSRRYYYNLLKGAEFRNFELLTHGQFDLFILWFDIWRQSRCSSQIYYLPWNFDRLWDWFVSVDN